MHRTTFYKHAGSIEEFAVDVITRELDAAATVPVDRGRDDRRDDDPDDHRDYRRDYRRAMVDVLTHVANERKLYRPLLSSRWGGALRMAIDERMRGRILLALDVFADEGGVEVPANRDEVAAFVSGGIVGTIVLWARSDDTDAEAWAARVQALMPPWWPVR